MTIRSSLDKSNWLFVASELLISCYETRIVKTSSTYSYILGSQTLNATSRRQCTNLLVQDVAREPSVPVKRMVLYPLLICFDVGL